MRFILETLITKKILEDSKFIFFFLPLIFLPIGSEYFETPKYYFLLVFSFLCLLSLRFKDINFKYYSILSFFIFILINLISSMQIFFRESFFGMSFMRMHSVLFLSILFVLLLFFAQKKFPKNYIDKIEAYLLVGIFISAILGIIQFLIKPLGIIDSNWYFDGRIVSTLGHPNFLASVLVIGLILSKRLKLNWVYLNLLLCLILTFSKTSIILYFIFLSYEYLKNLYLQNRKIAVTLILTIFTFLLFIIFGFFSNFYKDLVGNKPYMYQFQRFLVFLDPNELGLDLRFKIWSESIQAIKDSPYLGYGKGQIIRVIDLPEFNGLSLSSSHNLYLDIALESGLLGLTAFLFFIVSSLINSYRFNKYFFLIQFFISLHAFFDITSVFLWFIFIFISGISLNKSISVEIRKII